MFQIPGEDGGNATGSSTSTNPFNSHTTDLNVPHFHDYREDEAATVTIQPSSINDDSNRDTRRPIPVSTIDWQSRNVDQFMAVSGLDFLRGVEKICIEQTMELSDLTEHISSEKRYLVKVPQGGETLYRGNEESTSCQRTCFGSNRSFEMYLYDHTQQEVMVLKRQLAWPLCFYFEKLEIWASPGELIGTIEQVGSFTMPIFLAYDRHRTVIYRIEGPPMTCGCFYSNKDLYFKVLTADGMTQIGSINNQWDQLGNNYNLSVTFPSRRDDSRRKALLLGAAFLFEYMYFERQK